MATTPRREIIRRSMSSCCKYARNSRRNIQMTMPTIKLKTALDHLLGRTPELRCRVSVVGADSRALAPHSLKRAGPGSLLTAAALFALAMAGAARAEVSELRITKQPSIIYLPLVVMEQNKLVEKHAKAAGLPEFKMTWITFNS